MTTPPAPPTLRQIEFGLRFFALGLCFFNLALAFGPSGDLAVAALLAFVAFTAIAIGGWFYWGARWAVDEPMPIELANSALLASLLVLTGIGALFLAGSPLVWACFAAELAVAGALGFFIRRHMRD